MIIIVTAFDRNKLIGNNNTLPWNIPSELEHFKNTTLNKTILMGDVTFNSIGKVLSDRKTIVLTKDQNFTAEGVEVINNIDSIVNKYKSNPEEDIYICGGAKVYESFLPHVDKMIISLIKGEYEGDTFFPTYNENDFKLTSEVDHEEFIVKELNSL